MESITLKGKLTDHPLTPSVLSALGVIKEETLSEFHNNSHTANWQTNFVIWTTDGYIKTKNKYLGELSLTRRQSGQDEIQIDIEQIYYNADNVNHRIKAAMICRNNLLTSPVSWKLNSDFISSDNTANENRINFLETAHVDGNDVNITIANTSFLRKASGNFTTDWSLFSVIGQLAFDNALQYEFDLLEGLRRFRKTNRLFYKAQSELHRFQQIGSGILPYDYWLNDNHQLLMVITGNRAYIPVELISENWKKRSKAKDDDE
ncbi:MAG: hypothetical protein E4H13_01240 [Calditrichales bacterium]|nr:MAG: hypothetical protein E4H13_01240 [Calditrichales bacterium]